MKLSKELNKNPMDIALGIVKKLQPTDLFSFEVAKPGYINFSIKNTQKNNNQHKYIIYMPENTPKFSKFRRIIYEDSNLRTIVRGW